MNDTFYVYCFETCTGDDSETCLSNEEIVKLIQNGVDVIDNMQSLYNQNKSFMYKIARKFTMFSDIEDLMQEAYFGLDQSVKRFNFSQGVSFLTYAAFWIKQVLRRYIENNGRMVRIPVHELARVSRYQKLVNDCLLMYGEKPTKEYMMRWLGISFKALQNLERTVHAYNNIQSLDEPCGEDGSISIHETIPGDSSVEDEAIERCMREEPDIWDIIEEVLPKNEFEVVFMRYHGKLSLEAVAKHLGISRERVRQLEAAGLRHIRNPKTRRILAERYDIAISEYRALSLLNAPISARGITRRENAERRRQRLLESQRNIFGQ